MKRGNKTAKQKRSVGDSSAGVDASLTEAILSSISDGVFTVDHQWRITSFNRAAERITGVSCQEALGRSCAEVFRSSLCGAQCALRETLTNGEPIVGRAAYIITATGERIPISISTAVLRNQAGVLLGGAEVFRDLSEFEALKKFGLRGAGEDSLSPQMQRVMDIVPTVAACNSTVLICGETGTGKERLARQIHQLSERAQGPFVAVNCGALPDTLLESELFGYKAGAFTGATRDKPGRFALARGGTLFLDEIGETSPALQVRVLRVLQERVFEPLGAVQSEKADVRVIVATHRDLLTRIREGTFREDLYYRVNVVRIELPPLRHRREDIPLLVDHFIGRFNTLMNGSVKGCSADVSAMLLAHHWPGNIRELENIVERAFVLCARTGWIEVAHLPEELVSQRKTVIDGEGAWKQQRKTSERATICEALRHCTTCAEAAQRLGIHKTTLYRRMNTLGLTRQDASAVDSAPSRPFPR